MILGTPPPDGGWKETPLLAAVAMHQAAGHPGEALSCQHCRDRVDAALEAAFDRLPPGKAGRLFT